MRPVYGQVGSLSARAYRLGTSTVINPCKTIAVFYSTVADISPPLRTVMPMGFGTELEDA